MTAPPVFGFVEGWALSRTGLVAFVHVQDGGLRKFASASGRTTGKGSGYPQSPSMPSDHYLLPVWSFQDICHDNFWSQFEVWLIHNFSPLCLKVLSKLEWIL